MKSYGDFQKKESAPYKQLINILKSSSETEQAIERFFSKEMEYKVVTENNPNALSIIAKEYKDNFVFFPQKGMFGLHQGEAQIRLHVAEGLPEVFRRIANGEEGVFLAEDILVDSRGFIRKGDDGTSLSIREFRKKMKLETEIAEIDLQLKELSVKLNELQPLQRDLEKIRQTARDKKKAKEVILSGIEREAIDVTAQVRTMTERLSEITGRPEPSYDSSDLPSEGKLKDEIAKWENEKTGIEHSLADLKGRLEEVKKDYGITDEEYHSASITTERNRNQLKKNEDETSQKEASLDLLEKDRLSREEKAVQAERDLVRAMEKLANLETSYASLQEECKTMAARHEDVKTKLGDLHMEKVSVHAELQSLDQDIEKAEARQGALEKENIVIAEKKESIQERLRNDYGVENIDDVNVTSIGDEVEREEVLKELSTLGEVNFRAEKEQVELRERLEFLEKQNADLVQAMESLKKTISKIDSVSRELFLETFERVNDAFRRLTYTLFKGGHGTLTLNPDTNGIDMYVQPPGKKVIRMELLSGGEKALISLSFLLSLMETKASPFTLMDEIDAPLDDANLLSLLEIIKVIANRTQTILITHNRMTMESATTIYGVTMEQDGVSKTISIKL
jgi:chromosome segregation protein